MSFTASLAEIVRQDTSGLLGIHPGWCRVPLSAVATVLNGFPFASNKFSNKKGTPLIRIRDVTRGSTDTFFDGDYESAYLMTDGDLLVGMDGDFNCSLWRGGPGLLNQRVCRITPDERFYDKRFLALALPGYLAAINRVTSSITVKHLSSFTISEISLPLPPLAEQRRVVAEIEKQFSRLDAAVAALRRVQANLRRYRAAVLKAACEGTLVPTEAELTRAAGHTYESASELLARTLKGRRARWEADRVARMTAHGHLPSTNTLKLKYEAPPESDTSGLSQLPEGWCWSNAGTLAQDGEGSICAGPFGTIFKARDFRDTGIPIIFLRHVGEGRYLSRKPGFMDRQIWKDLFQQYSVFGGELLVTKLGDPPGVCALYPHDIGPAMVTPDVIKMSSDMHLVHPKYAMNYFNSCLARQFYTNRAFGTTRLRVTLPIFRAIPIPLPPIAEQARIVAEVERRLSVIEEVEANIAVNLKRAERTRQAVLQRAFSGVLVLQDSTDEPADVLLDRIRTERAHTGLPTQEKMAPRLRSRGQLTTDVV